MKRQISNDLRSWFPPNIGFHSSKVEESCSLTIRPLDTARVPGLLEARIYKPATRESCSRRTLHVHSTPKENINPFMTMRNEYRSSLLSQVQVDPNICQRVVVANQPEMQSKIGSILRRKINYSLSNEQYTLYT